VRLIIPILLIGTSAFSQGWNITPMAPLPEPVSNNAVCEGFSTAGTFIFSFGGIDSTKSHGGIHLRSYRMNVSTQVWESIPDLPDTMGKIAAGASRIGDIIYIIGGYHVFPNGNEVSSNRVHRYSISQNQYLPDGAVIPVPIDDHVQAVWRDSLIYVVTGWSNTHNVTDVQIYNPSLDVWSVGTSVPSSGNYAVFGASGVFEEDTLYYYGGAANGANFPAQRHVRQGIVDGNNPTEITWATDFFDLSIKGYRTAACRTALSINWIGGSDISYNYDGIAYNGTGGVPPSKRNLIMQGFVSDWFNAEGLELPMDLRGIAEIDLETKYLIGGMIDDQKVTSQVLKLEWEQVIWESVEEVDQQISIYPNPAIEMLNIASKNKINSWVLSDLSGRFLDSGNSTQIDLRLQHVGILLLTVNTDAGAFQKLIVKQ
jgi:hypothetical protein